MILYQIVNKVSGRKYYGITSNMKRRMASHAYSVRRGVKTPIHCSIRAYGWDHFDIQELEVGDKEYIQQREIELIAADDNCYNLHRGGHIGFDITTKDPKDVDEWKAKLRKARRGRKPALGMKHSEETKKLCGEYSKLRWDKYGRYPEEVLEYSFIEANKKFGISKTHYYRLRKAAAS